MHVFWKATILVCLMALIGVGYGLFATPSLHLEAANGQRLLPITSNDLHIQHNAFRMVQEGRHTFRFDTFGDEAFWGGQLRLHEAIANVSPAAALALGLKVDAAALPPGLVLQVQRGQVNLDDPAVTLALLKLNAVVGVTGFFSGDSLQSIGIQCALCHSTVGTSFSAPGIPPGNISQRLDGWPNRDLNVSAIIALAPNLTPCIDLLQERRQTCQMARRRRPA